MPQNDLAADKPPEITFQPVGRNHATTFTGLCGNHDHELFRTIEKNPLQISDSQHLFLLSYRAVLMEAHATRKAMIDVQLWYQRLRNRFSVIGLGTRFLRGTPIGQVQILPAG